MYLTFRRAQPSDFESGFPLVQARYGYDPSMRKDMIKLWRVLHENGHEPMCVSEDMDQPPGKRLVSLGVSIFAHDWFVEDAKTTLPPFMDRQIFEKWRGGKRPFLLKDEIIEAQLNGGVNAVAFNWGWDSQRYNPGEIHKIKETQSQSFLSFIPYYRLKEFVQEVIGAEEKDRLMNYGVDLLRDYKEFLGSKYFPGRAIGAKHPYLMSLSILEARKNPARKVGTAADALARLGPPRYGFQLNEQAVLKSALQGDTDEKIAKSLHLTLITVKRRWQSIYAKVAGMDAGFGEEKSGLHPGESGGFKQRRRVLLKMLAGHPEELWPNPPTKPKGKGKKAKN